MKICLTVSNAAISSALQRVRKRGSHYDMKLLRRQRACADHVYDDGADHGIASRKAGQLLARKSPTAC